MDQFLGIFLFLSLVLAGISDAADFPGEQWVTITPAEAGLSAARLNEARDYALSRAAISLCPHDTYWTWGLGDSVIVVIPTLDIAVARAGQSWKRGTPGAHHYEVLKPFLQPIVAAVNSGSARKP